MKKFNNKLVYIGMVLLNGLFLAYPCYRVCTSGDTFNILLDMICAVFSVFTISFGELLEIKRMKPSEDPQRFLLKSMRGLQIAIFLMYYLFGVVWVMDPDFNSWILLIFGSFSMSNDCMVLVRKADGLYFMNEYGKEYRVKQVVTKEAEASGVIHLEVNSPLDGDRLVKVKTKNARSQEWIRQLNQFIEVTKEER